jgi:hypothetical protein
MTTDKSFLGTGWRFPPVFSKAARGVEMVTEDEDIKESLVILLLTSPGERVMQPTYGCGLRSMVFDSIDRGTITELTDIIERAVLFFETRIRLNTVGVDTEKQYDGILKINFDYTIKTTNSRHNMVFPFYYREGLMSGLNHDDETGG